MRVHRYLLTAASFFYVGQALATPAVVAPAEDRPAPAKSEDTVTTGVAKGRDRLDSATSTSVLREAEITKLGARSIGEILRDVPGIRVEAGNGEAASNISIRGLPIATTGAKFVQLQEDGLPVLEFGDILERSADAYLRADLNLAQVEVIRGGSASTFASNSPGGIINFVSKNGDVEGGAVALTTGLDYDQYRADFDYGAHVTDSLRFHIGGFYRQGEGPRTTGYDAQRGGQIKLNVTKTFEGGYIRFYGKYLNDRTPFYDKVPIRITGTNSDPEYSALPGFDPTQGTTLSRYNQSNLYVDRNNNVAIGKLSEGRKSVVKSFGLEAQADLYGWTVTEKFRYSGISGNISNPIATYLPAAGVVGLYGAGPGTRLAYATGPQAGQTITDPSTLNGNGLLAIFGNFNLNTRSLDNVANDLRATRVWDIGKGDLTTTIGFYASRQTIDADLAFTTSFSEVRGDGSAALINLFAPTGAAITQNGYHSYYLSSTAGRGGRRVFDVHYDTNAPFASANYHIGRVSIGASVRYDYGKAQGQIFGVELGAGRIGNGTRDINGDGVIAPAETRVSVVPINAPAPVDYSFHALSYSTGINFRIAEPLAVFARYSRGARTNADRLLFTPIVSYVTGGLNTPSAAVDAVKQAEAGVKYRQQNLTLNVTGFWAKVDDSNYEVSGTTTVIAQYIAKGVEFEGGVRQGPFSLNGGVTYTDAEISANKFTPAVVGNTPRRQPKFIFQATPQVTFDRFNIGAVFIGVTDSYAQNVNLLKMPGYVTTNAFVQVRPADRLLLTLNASNLFDTTALVEVTDATIPASGLGSARVLNGRTVSLTARFDF